MTTLERRAARDFEVPMTELPDGRLFVADETCAEHPEVRQFIGRFSNYWTWDVNRCGFTSPASEAENGQ